MDLVDARIALLRGLILVHLALGLPACATSRTPATPGQRVELPVRSILESDRPSDRSSITGELMRSSPDTACIREARDSEPRCFGLRSETTLSPKMATDVSDPWLMGDSLRVRQPPRVLGKWAVTGSRGDTLLLSGDSVGLLRMVRTSELSTGRLQRQVFRARPAAPLLLGSLALGGGLLWARHLSNQEAEPGDPFFTAGDLALAMIVSAVVGGGGVLILASPVPRVGWDDVEVRTFPPVRVGSSADGGGPSIRIGLQIGVR